ncbi:hypothetical protein [Variovorax paradoxus]|uniref:hypothetical protein n=1 Tax=Variovorax paradoxus TaxID=34073 RepID=UPI003D65F4DE
MNKYLNTACLWAASACLASPFSAAANSIFYPSPTPTSVTASEPIPAWLAEGVGDDGYMRVLAEPSLRSGCLPLGDAGWLKVVNKETVQLVVTLVVTGIDGPLTGKEVPIATLASNKAGDCVLLNSHSVNIVPLTRLRFVNPGDADSVKFELRVRTTSETKLNLVGAAQASLGLASIFATGGAASTVVLLSSKLTEPAMAGAEKFFEEQAKAITPAQAPFPSSLSQLRTNVRRIDFPVYLGEYNSWRTDAGKAMRTLQDSLAKDAKPALTISVKLFFSRSVFPLQLFGPTHLPKGQDIKNSQILKYPNLPGSANLLQVLTGSDPEQSSFLQSMAVASATNAQSECKRALDTLELQGLNLVDRVIALKAFIDTAKKSSSWYTPSFLNQCFGGGFSSGLSLTKAIYGEYPPPPSTDRDAIGVIAQTPLGLYEKWTAAGVPFLYRFQNAVLATENREAQLAGLTGGSDIELRFQSGESPWPILNDAGTYSKISQLTSKKFIAAGCFSYKQTGFDPSIQAGHLLLRDDAGGTWVAEVEMKRNVGGSATLTSVQINKYQGQWAKHYDALFEFGYFPSPLSDQCSQVRKT